MINFLQEQGVRKFFLDNTLNLEILKLSHKSINNQNELYPGLSETLKNGNI